MLTLSPPSSHSVGSTDPELSDTTLFVTVSFLISKPIFWLYENKSKDVQAGISALREFVTVGDAGFLASRSERVK